MQNADKKSHKKSHNILPLDFAVWLKLTNLDYVTFAKYVISWYWELWHTHQAYDCIDEDQSTEMWKIKCFGNLSMAAELIWKQHKCQFQNHDNSLLRRIWGDSFIESNTMTVTHNISNFEQNRKIVLSHLLAHH